MVIPGFTNIIQSSTGQLVSHATCLQSAQPPSGDPPDPVETPPDLSHVPPVYHEFAEVFCKSKALSLPPHCPYDCAIDLLPGAPLPKSRRYSLSRAEREVMEKYISDSLSSGIIRPSLLQWGLVSSLWRKGTSLCDPVLTIVN